MFYYEIIENYRINEITNYVYEKHFDHFLSTISNRVFELEGEKLMCIKGFETTYYYLDPKETTFILLSATPRNNRLSNYFNPGHA